MSDNENNNRGRIILPLAYSSRTAFGSSIITINGGMILDSNTRGIIITQIMISNIILKSIKDQF